MIILVLAARRPHTQHLGRDDYGRRQHKTGFGNMEKPRPAPLLGNRCKEITNRGLKPTVMLQNLTQAFENIKSELFTAIVCNIANFGVLRKYMR